MLLFLLLFFFFNDTATTEIYTLSLHDALPISKSLSYLPPNNAVHWRPEEDEGSPVVTTVLPSRSEEHTSELQSRRDLVCRLLLEKKKKDKEMNHQHALNSGRVDVLTAGYYDQF